jgi:gas vesicle protein
MSKTIVGVFDSHDYAEKAAIDVKNQGLRTEDISIIARQGDDASGKTGSSKTGSGKTGSSKTGSGKTGSSKTGSSKSGSSKSGTSMDAGGHAVNDNISDGVVTGGVLGGLAGLLIGAGSLVIPGLGIIAAAGPITGLLSGAVTGGIVGGLVDLGIPENKSKQYESEVKAGRVLFSMRTDEDKIDKIASILRHNGAVNVESY